MVGAGAKYSGSIDRVNECSELNASEVMGPEVNGDRMRARKGETMLSGGREVISSTSDDTTGMDPRRPTLETGETPLELNKPNHKITFICTIGRASSSLLRRQPISPS